MGWMSTNLKHLPAAIIGGMGKLDIMWSSHWMGE